MESAGADRRSTGGPLSRGGYREGGRLPSHEVQTYREVPVVRYRKDGRHLDHG